MNVVKEDFISAFINVHRVKDIGVKDSSIVMIIQDAKENYVTITTHLFQYEHSSSIMFKSPVKERDN